MVAVPVFARMEAECASSNINFLLVSDQRVFKTYQVLRLDAETSGEFAVWMKDHFSLKGPKETAPKEKPMIRSLSLFVHIDSLPKHFRIVLANYNAPIH